MCRIQPARDNGLLIDALKLSVIELCQAEEQLKARVLSRPFRLEDAKRNMAIYNRRVGHFTLACRYLRLGLEALCQDMATYALLDSKKNLRIYNKLRWRILQIKAMPEMVDTYTVDKLNTALSSPNGVRYESPLELFHCYVAPVFGRDLFNGTMDTHL